METNPLLRLGHRLEFDQIKTEHVEPAFATLLAECRAALTALGQAPTPRTYENTLEVLDHLTTRLDEALSVVRHLEGVATTPELRAAFNKIEPEVMAFYASIPLDEPLWKAVQAVRQSPGDLDPIRERFLQKTYDGFRRHGAWH